MSFNYIQELKIKQSDDSGRKNKNRSNQCIWNTITNISKADLLCQIQNQSQLILNRQFLYKTNKENNQIKYYLL